MAAAAAAYIHPSASRSRRSSRRVPGSSCPGSPAMLCIHTMHARGSSYHRSGRLGEDREAGAGEPECGEAGSFPPQLSGAVYQQSSTNSSPQRAGRPAGGPWGERQRIGAKFCSPLRLPASDDGGRRLVCERLRAHKTLRVPTQSRSPGRWAKVAQVLGAFFTEHQPR